MQLHCKIGGNSVSPIKGSGASRNEKGKFYENFKNGVIVARDMPDRASLCARFVAARLCRNGRGWRCHNRNWFKH
jgi:hypothetical protein